MGEVIGLLFLLGLCVAIVVLLPAAGLWWLVKWFKSQNYRWTAVVVQVLLAGFVIFWILLIYSFYFLFDGELKDEFVRITALPFPESGEIIRGDESGLDPHGNYIVCARIKVSTDDYTLILKKLRADSAFRPTHMATDSSFVSSKEFQYATQSIKPSDYVYSFARGQVNVDAYTFVGFLHDRCTIVIYRCST
ncbi:hypothetical protein [Hymenobacter wooponensis]|uniref:Uncharacterized protein n=1 Tax=Hymenobacter wooponensis TaxID=1525360 RepID=A0A4Z0MT11_9BACT|nr:hypothetical protein [Hymenobacter wooponensis]TGD82754.1 hypothetical protein EU557_02935 [Hymenobacter wooponensis]